jgi:hypothetical protein
MIIDRGVYYEENSYLHYALFTTNNVTPDDGWVAHSSKVRRRTCGE